MNFMIGFIAGFMFGALFIPLSFYGPSLFNRYVKIKNKWLEAVVLLAIFVSIIAIGAFLTSAILDAYSSSDGQRKKLGKNSSMGMYVGLLCMGLVISIAYRISNRKN